MPNLKKGGQVAIFVILGVILLILFLGAIFYFSGGGFKPITRTQVSFSEDVQSFKTMRDSCLQKKFLEAKELFGVEENPLTQLKYEAYLKDQFQDCMNNEIIALSGRGIKVIYSDFSSTVKISEDAINMDAKYPVTLSKGDQTERLSEFSYNWKTERAKTIAMGAGGRASDDIIITSTDQKMELKILKGTVVTTSTGQPVTKIEVNVLDKYFNGMVNPLVIGDSVYDYPDLQFSQNALITYKYETSDLLPTADETQLKISYYDTARKVWTAWPDSQVDTVKKTVTAWVPHLSTWSDVLCGNENNLPQTIYDLKGSAPRVCSKNQPGAYSPPDYQIPFTNQYGCDIETGNNLRVWWSCTDKCENIEIITPPSSTSVEPAGTTGDVPVLAKFTGEDSNKLSFEVVYKEDGACCVTPDPDGPLGCAVGEWGHYYSAEWEFKLILFYGTGFYDQCIDSNTKKSFSVPSDGCICGVTTIDKNSPVYDTGQSVKCCADGTVACGGSTCDLENCALNTPLETEDTGCWCNGFTFQPNLEDSKDLNYCCEAGKDCSAAPCKVLIGEEAVETCYCKDDSQCDGMTCDKEHCCATGKCWNTDKCTACAGPVANCSDKIMNQGEEGVDCGGPCPTSCGLPAHCSNNQKDADETGEDCGGADCDPCYPDHCKNTIKDGDETDTNCGGSCPKCANGKICTDNSDCVSDYCLNGICTALQFDKPNILDIVIEK